MCLKRLDFQGNNTLLYVVHHDDDEIIIIPFPVFLLRCCTTRVLWDLWWSGNSVESIAPYRQIRHFDLHDRRDFGFLSKAKKVMNTLVDLCPGELTVVAVSRKNTAELDQLFEAAYLKLCNILYPGVELEVLDYKRVGDRKYVTVYDFLCKLKM